MPLSREGGAILILCPSLIAHQEPPLANQVLAVCLHKLHMEFPLRLSIYASLTGGLQYHEKQRRDITHLAGEHMIVCALVN